MRDFRRFLDDVLSLCARVILHLFFRRIEVKGRENLEGTSGALLLVANHGNNLIDPFLLLGMVGRRPRFLAKSTLWSHPVVAPLLVLVGAVPVYRHQDGARTERNLTTFARCLSFLRAGGTVALFPEGRSHNEPGPLPLKTGAARIALETAVGFPAARLRIVPVGLIYEDKERFRSRVLIQVGEPIDPAEEVAQHPDAGPVAVRQLTARIASGLEAVTVRFASWEEARLVNRAADLASGEDVTLSARRELWRCLMKAYRSLDAEDPHRAAQLLARLKAWDASERGPAPRRVRLSRALVFLLPGLLGIVLNWIPYRLPGWVSRALTKYPDEPATYKLLTALVAFPVAWVLESAAAARWCGPEWGAGLLLVAPASGYAALLLGDALGWRLPPTQPAETPGAFPAEERRALADEVRRLCAGAL